jgi:hypothetical protein
MISTGVLGCAPENDPVAEHLRFLRAKALELFERRIERAVSEGELRPDTDTKGLARFLGAITQGMSVQARDGASQAELGAIVRLAVDELRRHAETGRSSGPSVFAAHLTESGMCL